MGVKGATIAEKETAASVEERALGEKIIRDLKASAVVDSDTSVEIAVKAGVVHLYGTVLMQAEKQLLEEIVRATEGVASVRNYLEILPCSRKGPRQGYFNRRGS